jgi:hypothetical protein
MHGAHNVETQTKSKPRRISPTRLLILGMAWQLDTAATVTFS